ncbi:MULTISPECIES: DNA repair protein RecN [Bifidobacterium]|jgi:DNA repair protein RecN (Recombination protein N)|uniref:DNA repair protein RecN n=1 Tax=Bifidobacterium tibiigranuli TaxID=2172043 RepID=A0A5N6RVM4_9BIFI|nr:DNA repair protein RecN [Bifidobacterium tibiigranuli]KAE8126437.1 DNA repair protein RecN [Bifidobacterium tibiigranuli]KAE8126496.1 DNA repair protein RecN [Bifidobacterium tibiigranuli]MCI1212186.1 DNA repair protein RecN [Bifidobacterium tibiigranuli]MCI1221297.1 DNA repair protein RecN [Bifidobacterium tibiigranuli]MCI1232258.1 DNA repair protein RecN [Bifidobacterium tibiigranuli]
MLNELEISALGPIGHARLAFSPGMTAITGETGAGKSMLLNAVRLISGGSADSGQVSAQAGEAWAQGVFAVSPDSAAAAVAQDAGSSLSEDGELFLSRTVPSSGRSRAVLCGHSVPRSVLADLSAQLVTIHGQADQLRIASSVRQREFLDMVAGDEQERGAYRAAWDELRALDERLSALKSQEASVRQRADYLRESIERINAVDPHPGEDEDLKAKRSRIENAADITRGVGQALAALDSSQIDVDAEGPGAAGLIEQAQQSLRAIHASGPFEEAADRLVSITTDIADVVFTLSSQLDADEDVDDLDSLNARIHELGELTRRWGPSVEDVIAWRDQAVLDMEDMDASPEKLEELEARRGTAYRKALQAAEALSRARSAAAKQLSKTVSEELGSLAMAGARLDIQVTQRAAVAHAGAPATKTTRDSAAAHRSLATRQTQHGQDSDTGPLDAHGRDDIEFLFTPFPGSAQLPMGKSASGGELSRLMLALELAAADKRGDRSEMTFIFDEVDAGVGGKAAVELGRRLARLARHAQVIVVTHLAQVASWADAQFVVAKEIGTADIAEGSGGTGDRGATPVVATGVSAVHGEARVREIARMLSGSESAASLNHARELLASSDQ